MATAVVAGFLDINSGGGSYDDLALKVYIGQILGAYNKAITTEGRHIQREIANGKSAQFPVFGRVGSSVHTRGTEVTFGSVNHNEVVISIEDVMMAPLFLTQLDEAKSHYPVRPEYAVQQGQELAAQADQRVLGAFIAASRTSTANFTGGDVTAGYANAAALTDAAVIKAGIYSAAEQLDTYSVPNTDRFAWVKPSSFYLLLQDGEFLDRDFGGDGSRATAVMRNAADFTVVKTNNLPSTDKTGATDWPTRLKLDYTTNVAVCGHSSAAGSVTLMGLQFESEYDMNRQGTMFIAKYAKGFDYLRPEASVEISTS